MNELNFDPLSYGLSSIKNIEDNYKNNINALIALKEVELAIYRLLSAKVNHGDVVLTIDDLKEFIENRWANL